MKKFFVIAILIVFSIWTVSANLSDSFFCLVRKNDVVISLKQTDGFYRCKDTIASLEQLMINTAKDLMKVQTYINNGRDVEYRKTVKLEKQALLEKLQLSKTTIITNMQTFETNLVKKSVQYFILTITPYKIRLQKSLMKIAALSGVATTELNNYAIVLKAQVGTIESIAKSTTMQELSTLLARYVYLKKIIEWRYE